MLLVSTIEKKSTILAGLLQTTAVADDEVEDVNLAYAFSLHCYSSDPIKVSGVL